MHFNCVHIIMAQLSLKKRHKQTRGGDYPLSPLLPPCCLNEHFLYSSGRILENREGYILISEVDKRLILDEMYIYYKYIDEIYICIYYLYITNIYMNKCIDSRTDSEKGSLT